MNTTLEEEITSINAIYGDDTLERAGDHVILRVPFSQVAFRLTFPSDYPESSPQVVRPESTGAALPKGEAHRRAERAVTVLNDSFRVGQPCVYDLLEILIAEAEAQQSDANGQARGGNADLQADEGEQHGTAGQDYPEWFEEPKWVLSEVVSEKKSIFLARAVAVSDPETAKQNIRYLITTDKKAARATHNVTAWRIRAGSQSSIVYQDCDDDGETAAGGRLLHLLELMGLWNVMVVVTRWYGGIHLGPDRFRIFNSTARDALVKAGFTEQNISGSKVRHK